VKNNTCRSQHISNLLLNLPTYYDGSEQKTTRGSGNIILSYLILLFIIFRVSLDYVTLNVAPEFLLSCTLDMHYDRT